MGDRRRLRQIGATILLALGGIGLVVASTGWWLERNFLHTSRFTDTANEILDQDEVQAELTSVLVRQLSRQAGTDLQVAEPFLASIVGQVVDSDAFRAVFDTALSNAHRVLVDRNTGAIILDLTAAYDQIKGPLQQVAPKLADDLPSRKELELVLLHRSQLTTVWDAIDEVKRIVGFLTLGATVLLAAGVALAVERWRAVARGAWIVAGSGAFLVLALFVARTVLRSRISDGVLADAVVASFRVITAPLLVQSLVVVAVATLVALAARFTAEAGLPAWRPVARACVGPDRGRAARTRGRNVRGNETCVVTGTGRGIANGPDPPSPRARCGWIVRGARAGQRGKCGRGIGRYRAAGAVGNRGRRRVARSGGRGRALRRAVGDEELTGLPATSCLARRCLLRGGLPCHGLLATVFFVTGAFFAAAFFLAGAFFFAGARLPLMTASLKALRGVIFTERLAGFGLSHISSPVAGFRPIRRGLAGTSRRANFAKPLSATASPFETDSVMRSWTACRASSALRLSVSMRSESAAMSSRRFMGSPGGGRLGGSMPLERSTSAHPGRR